MEAIGTALTAILDGTKATASPAPCVERPPSLQPTTMAECRAITAWANATMPRHVPATPKQLTRRLEYLEAMLPRRATDDDAGELRTAGYLALLQGQSDDAMRHLVREACQTLDWFPTAKQCLAILATYRKPMPEQEQALIACQHFAQAAFEGWLANVGDGQPVGDVPDTWLRFAVDRAVLRRLSNGAYVARSLYYGPLGNQGA